MPPSRLPPAPILAWPLALTALFWALAPTWVAWLPDIQSRGLAVLVPPPAIDVWPALPGDAMLAAGWVGWLTLLAAHAAPGGRRNGAGAALGAVGLAAFLALLTAWFGGGAQASGRSFDAMGFLAGLVLGAVLGAIAAKRLPMAWFGPAMVRRWWPWFAGSVLLLVLPPLAPDGSLAHPLVAPWQEVPERLYTLIKFMTPWLPLGVVLAIAGQGHTARAWAIAAVLSLLLTVNLGLADWPWGDVLRLAAALPGLALGLWLVERGGWQTDAGLAAPVSIPDAAVSSGLHLPHEPRHPEVPSVPMVPAPAVSWSLHLDRAGMAAQLAGGATLLVCLALIAVFPRWPLALGAGLVAYAALLWWRPWLWLVAVPGLLPVLDLAPWTGRFFWDEFDLLMLTTLAVVLLRGHAQGAAVPSRGVWPLLLPGLLLVLISALIGVDGLPAPDANAFYSYWSPHNAGRVTKGFLWGLVFLFMVLRQRPGGALLARALALGLGFGLLSVCLVGVWERWLYAGLSDGDSQYRIVGLFSSMHTGGGHIEAYMAAALPFLWLGLGRPRTMILALPLLALSLYVLVFTASRGGALAFALIILLLTLGGLRLAWLAGRWRAMAAILVAASLALGGLLAGAGGGYFQQRFQQAGADAQTRMEHWRSALAMRDDDALTQLFGMGLGSFPRTYLARAEPDTRPATFAFVRGDQGLSLALGSGATLYYAQRVAVQPATQYRLSLDARARDGATRLDTPLCEKQMLNSRRCVWHSFDLPGDGRWHRLEATLSSGDLAKGGALGHLPVELSLYHAGGRGVLEADNVRLTGPDGRDLLCNGDFEAAGDCWFFKTHSHLPWHIKNVWVHLLFEQGWLGLLSFLMLLAVAARRLWLAAWGGEPLAWTLLASLAGLLTVGLFDSLVDAPRLMLLLTGFSLLGLARVWQAQPIAAGKRRRRGRRDLATASDSSRSSAA